MTQTFYCMWSISSSNNIKELKLLRYLDFFFMGKHLIMKDVLGYNVIIY